MIDLGDKVKDKISGFAGIVIARTEWLNGCVRLTVASQEMKDGVPVADQTFDETQLEVSDRSVIAVGKKERGGPRPSVAPTGRSYR